ncbi:hypothetical protein MUK42_22106 [Musa troglodytarum]|uniref:Vesicle-fusing ATPase n=1 Tax=Musa troglodytarum TaxID=320322 RepID=A0A9E7KAT5_9LILI|nr:hypothetical protein MUK42_22106 [Musa troglodytarum]
MTVVNTRCQDLVLTDFAYCSFTDLDKFAYCSLTLSNLNKIVNRVKLPAAKFSVIKLGIKHVKGMLLYGPLGIAKKLMARQIGKLLNGKEPKTHVHIHERVVLLVEQFKVSQGSPLVTCLLEGPSGRVRTCWYLGRQARWDFWDFKKLCMLVEMAAQGPDAKRPYDVLVLNGSILVQPQVRDAGTTLHKSDCRFHISALLAGMLAAFLAYFFLSYISMI